ncbi:uncharacterized protein PHACADRAFT_206156 [Phanerochaete carnosa HHB-10118-sp]|uniref:Polyketide synthase phosphopantetheine-binding domain-containing protein n=1 Tax=Phanerochaete carnosa (strain HHB-10118-sp) TaxID=650164 RepID=K5XAI9_PHACS|nr:uncharacterized protein PHACADRAFT_206156 [Phanerochaete carnosa HHB-10118-sp]EKM59937.1 hypothetical protein PHACADRAFT_206156 [Phanerochaete carnosa HHB-10118-sp]
MDTRLSPLDSTLLTIPEIVDFHATHNTNNPWFVFLSKDSPEELVSISYHEMAQTSHRIAHRMRPNREGPDGEVVVLLVNTDAILYIAVVVGLIRAGLVPYPVSPRNSPQGVCHILETVSCTRIIAHTPTAALAGRVQRDMHAKGVTLRVDELPSLSETFPKFGGDANAAAAEVQPYPPPGKPVDVRTPVLYLHSSGSTGYPKSIHFTHRRMLQWIARDYFSQDGVRYGTMGLASFHSLGIVLQLIHPLATGAEVVVYTPQYPAPPVVAHPQNAYEVAKLAKCNALTVPPSFIDTKPSPLSKAWLHSQEILEYLKTLNVLMFGGGPLAVSTGDKLVQMGVRLHSSYGSTEIGDSYVAWGEIPAISYEPDPNWAWFHAPPNAPNIKWDPQGDGTYELVVYETDDYDLPVHNVPGERAYATSDLVEPHPTKPNLWRIVGRKDDVIILSTGEKIVPVSQEGYISASPLVSGCIMFGREREQPGIIVEPQPAYAVDPNDMAALAKFRNKIWTHVEEANAQVPGFAKIFKEMILVTDPDKPLPRAAKRTIIRNQALAVYKEKIEQLYETISASTDSQGINPPRSWKAADLEPWLTEQAESFVSHGRPIALAVDLLSATFFRNRIIGALRASGTPRVRRAAQHVPANLVFERPSIQQFASALAALVDQSADADAQRSPADEIRGMIAKYTADMPRARAGKAVDVGAVPVVLLTGSTGNIGSHILACLLAEPRIARVYALNRPSADPHGRLAAAFRERGLPEKALDDPRLVSLVGDVTHERFGLDEAQYNDILASATHVIHNAWTVNFKLALQSFEDQVAGVRKLVDIAAATDRPLRLLVTSSIGVANAWNPAEGPVPEQLLSNPGSAAGTGYAASKYVVEHILSAARGKGVPATAVRMGQVCGPKETGAWGTTEWMPFLTKSSVVLGCLPALSGSVTWVPLDAIGEAYVDWVLAQDALPALVNVVHPRPTTWDVVLHGLRQELGDNLPVVPLEEWVMKLEERAKNPSAEDLVQIPALKITEFFCSLVRPAAARDGAGAAGAERLMGLAYETVALSRSSPTMRELQPMSAEHARAWVRFWKAKGFIATSDCLVMHDGSRQTLRPTLQTSLTHRHGHCNGLAITLDATEQADWILRDGQGKGGEYLQELMAACASRASTRQGRGSTKTPLRR